MQAKAPRKESFCKTSGTEVRIAIRSVVPVDVELVVPVRVRHVAITIARTSVALLHRCHRKARPFCIYEFPAVLAGVVLSKASSFSKRQIIIIKTDLTVANQLYTKRASLPKQTGPKNTRCKVEG